MGSTALMIAVHEPLGSNYRRRLCLPGQDASWEEQQKRRHLLYLPTIGLSTVDLTKKKKGAKSIWRGGPVQLCTCSNPSSPFSPPRPQRGALVTDAAAGAVH